MKKMLVLVMAAVLLLVCAGCAKNNQKSEMISFTIYNRTGGKVTDLVITDKQGKQSISTKEIADGSHAGLSLNAVLVSDGKADLDMTFFNADGVQVRDELRTDNNSAVTLQKDGSVSYKAPEQ